MSNAPTVDVLLSCRNASSTIQACVNSILTQDYQNIRLFIFEDASIDGTPEILAGYTDPRLHVVYSPFNIGTYASKNFLIKHLADSPYIALHDADDESLSSRISKQIHFMESHDDCLCLGTAIIERSIDGANIHTISSSNNASERINLYPRKLAKQILSTIHDALDNPDESYHRLLQVKICMNGSVMIRRSVLEQLGGWAGHTFVGADTELFGRILSVGSIYNLQEPLYIRTFHANSLTQVPSFSLSSDYRKLFNLSTLPAVKSALDGNPYNYEFFTPPIDHQQLVLTKGGKPYTYPIL